MFEYRQPLPLPERATLIEELPDKMTTYWLQMKEKPEAPLAAHPPRTTVADVILRPCSRPSIEWYRYLYSIVGTPWYWWIRNSMNFVELQKIIHDYMVEIQVLFVAGEPAGFFELDFRPHPSSVNIAYFGLAPAFLGKGFGPWMLSQAVDIAWVRHGKPGMVTINTCTLDHPGALKLYRKIGFSITDKKKHDLPPFTTLKRHCNLHRTLREGVLPVSEAADKPRPKKQGPFNPIKPD